MVHGSGLEAGAEFDGSGWNGLLRTPTRTAALPGPRSIWWRRPSGFNFKHLASQDAGYALHQYLDRAGLVFGAFDFAVDCEGTPWFLECNPNGQFLWFEGPTGLPLTAAMADLLEGEQ